MYGISQNPGTKGYIIVLQYAHCEECSYEYVNIKNTYYKWCKPCQINNFKKNFTNWTSGNEKIDDLIQEIQLTINDPDDIVFEWIPYNQFSNIKVISKDGFDTANWKDGPLHYNKKWTRDSEVKV